MFAFAPLREVFPQVGDTFPNLEALDQLGFTEYEVVEDGQQLVAKGKVAWLKEIEFDLLGLDAVGVALLAQGGMTVIAFEHRLAPNFELVLHQLNAAFRIKSGLLQRVRQEAGQWVPDLDGEGKAKRPEILLTAGTLRIDGDWDVTFLTPPALFFPPVMLGQTGIVLEVQQVALFFSAKELNPPEPGFKGVTIEKAGIYFTGGMAMGAPNQSSVQLLGARIGSSGFSGKITATWGAAGQGTLFGVPFKIDSLMAEFRQNVPVDSSIKGTLELPFFEAPVKVELRYGVDGGLLVRLDKLATEPFLKLEKPGILEIELESLAFRIDGGRLTVSLAGQLTPLFQADQGLAWPSFEVRELSIDSQGHVHLDGGWLNLPDQKFLDFHGFKIEISQLGFGRNANGSKWVGFSGGLKLVEGLQAGASVEGLRITWFASDPGSARITLNGAGVELAIPGVLQLKGEVSYKEIETSGGTVRRFDGDITLRLETPQLAIDGAIVIGSLTGSEGRFNFFAVYVDVELPTGIPLGATGLGIYGFAGLFALRMEPDKHGDEPWFSIDKAHSFYHRKEEGITDLGSKWVPRKGSFALGAGLTLATYADNGYTFNGKFLLVLVIPGPILLLQGAASFLKKRGESTSAEGQFRALAVYDGRGGSVTIGLDAEYKTGQGGELIEIGGSMEAFYAFDDPTSWHLWLGRYSPREQRIRALLGRFVEANAYFMLDAHELALGAWFGYSNRWGFGPLRVRLEAWAEGNARLSFRPTHFHGDLWLHCLVELSAFGFGLGVALDARIAADLFRPYHLRAELKVGIKLPWPFKKRLEATVTLEWGPRRVAPPLPLPLTQVAIEHQKSTVVWPIARGQHLLPSWDDGAGYVAHPAPAPEVEPDLAQLPLAPLDARIALTFGRSVQDVAKVGITPQQAFPATEPIGDPKSGRVVATAAYSLAALELSRWNGQEWAIVAKNPPEPEYPPLFGAWAATPALPDGRSPGDPPRIGQSKLLLWADTPYVFTRATGSAWDEWIADGLGGFPCPPLLPATETCFGFESLAAGTELKSPWKHPDGAFTLSWGFGAAQVVEETLLFEGRPFPVNVLCFPAAATGRGVAISWARPARAFRLRLWQPQTQPQPQPFPLALFGEGNRDSSGSSGDRVCAELASQVAGTHPNPLAIGEVRFTVRGADGKKSAQTRIERWGGLPLGLDAGQRLEVDLPCATPWVELAVSHRSPSRIVAYDGSGAVVATHSPSSSPGPLTETVRLAGPAIRRLELGGDGCQKLVHALCYACPRPTGPTAEGMDGDGNSFGPFTPDEAGEIVGQGEEITGTELTSPTSFCLIGICVTPDPEAGFGVHRDELIRHANEQLTRWQSRGPLLEPDSFYRLAISTHVKATPLAEISLDSPSPLEHAYFRTEGPPGITQLPPPKGVDADHFDSGLDDLVRYVAATDPPTVPPAGAKPILYKPFYRAYDIGVEFNESYVEQMYRAGGRDLGLYVFDAGNRPARDVRGRLLVLGARWGEAETVTLTAKDEHWVALVDRATCLTTKLDPATRARSSALVAADPDRVLAADTLHEARLVPLLLRETFAGVEPPGLPAGWHAEDGGSHGPSAWQVGEQGEPAARFLEQLAPVDRTTLYLADSAGWTDYRLSVYVRAGAGEVGIEVRRDGPGQGYRFTLGERFRRLVELAGGNPTTLAEDSFAYQRNRDYRLTVEALEQTLRAYVDGEPAGEIAGATHLQGGIGLYCAGAANVRFTDVAVDDLRRNAPVVYRFQLTTSLYANFFHHFQSFEERLWRADLSAQDFAAELAAKVPPSAEPPLEEEARAFEELAAAALHSAARQAAPRLELTRVASEAGPLLLLRSPEPLDPRRLLMALERSERRLPAGSPPGVVKLADAEVGAATAAFETVSLLLRDAADLTRHRLELREIPWLLDPPAGDPLLFLETFADAGARRRFTTNEPEQPGMPSAWRVESGALVELSGAGGGNEPELPGRHAIAGESGSDYRVLARLRGDAGGELGILVRYADEDNYYRLSAGAARGYRRLVKCVAGVTQVLWQDSRGYDAGEPFRLGLQAVGARLVGFFGDEELFDLHDPAHAAGRVGIYAAANFGARCEELEVRRPTEEARAIFADRFAHGDLAAFTFADGPAGPAVVTPPGPLNLFELGLESGTGIAGEATWGDTVVQARAATSGGALGVLVRADAGGAIGYRFSLCPDDSVRRLEKLAGGASTVLWSDQVPTTAFRPYELTLSAIGSTLRGFVDGAAIFAVDDAELATGRIGIHCASGGSFSAVSVWNGAAAFASWLLDERFGAELPPEWTFLGEDPPWQVNEGWLGVAPDAAGAHSALATSPPVEEFRLGARLRLDVAGQAGVLFGWRDPANHQALFLDIQGATLTRISSGAAATLAAAPAVLDPDREYLVELEQLGARLSVAIDGVEVLAVDTPPAAGTFGFAIAAQPGQNGSGFRELRVAVPQWTPWYAFGAEERRPAGKVIRLHSGAIGTPDFQVFEPNVEKRSAAPPGERGRLRFPAAGATLRVVAPGGEVGHTRLFLPRSAFEPAPFEVLRKADGTAAFLVPSPPLPAGTRSLALTGVFGRDRPAAGRPMSQAGDRIDEVARLTFEFE